MARRTATDALPPQTERSFQAQVVELLKLNGWPPELIYHTLDSRGSQAGFPDVVACRPRDGRLLIAELKREGKGPTADQRQWLDGLRTVRHFDVHLWRPSDFEQIARILR